MTSLNPTAQEQLLKDVTTFLTESNIPYMVTGSLSVIRYGRPRTSHDIDFIIEADNRDALRIKKVFASLPRKEFIVDPIQVEQAIHNASQFNILHLPTMLKLDFWLLQPTPFDKERFKRRREIHVFGKEIIFTSPEDTILKKFLWYRESKIEKHMIDAAFVYQIQEENLDKKYLTRWAKALGAEKFLEEIANINLEQYY